MPRSKYDDFVADDEEGLVIDHETYKSQLYTKRKADEYIRRQDKVREVGVVPEPTPEMLARRELLANDWILMHREMFPDSTGETPFGQDQIDSINWDQQIFKSGGRVLKLEPRGFAKTTKLTNEALFATLLGWQKFTVIVASSMEKASDILAAIKTELNSSTQLYDIFPGPCACFMHIKERGQNAVYQTYGGEPTHLKFTADSIHFPTIPGEPSSGAIIKVRPLTNLKGINYKIRSGPDRGKVYRPTLYIFDDPQTEDDATSPTQVKRIISNIKRSALKGGSHTRPAAAIMAITPVFYGDVAWHFEKMEESWDIKRYPMIRKWPDQYQRWLTEYAEIRGNYDRSERGTRIKAYQEARQFVLDNYDDLHAGAQVAWEAAFTAGEPLFEVSAVQHAINVILDDGMEDFEFEYQCNTEYGVYQDEITIHCPANKIAVKQHEFPRRVLPQETRRVVSHIDVNKDILTFVTVSSGNPMRPHIIDYGTYPKQTGIWSKKKGIGYTLRANYTNPDYREVLYLAVKDMIEYLAQRVYVREDGSEFTHSLIGVDVKYEEQYIARAIRESPFRNIVVPTWGMFVGPDDELVHNQKWPVGTTTYDNCADVVRADNPIMYFNYDTNFMKTELHKGFNLDTGVRGSVTLFKEEYVNQHMIFGEHCNTEFPERKPGVKTNRTRIAWKEKAHQIDNEWFDNASCCLALLRRCGIQSENTPTPIFTEKDEIENNIANLIDRRSSLLDY